MNAEPADDPVEQSIEILRSRGDRITVSRRLIIEELASSGAHLSADDLLERVRSRAPAVHLATVYRTLEALVQSGVATHVHLPHGATTYHLNRPGHRSHLHVLCRACNRLIDVPPDTLDGVADRLAGSHGFRLDPHHVALTGVCGDCDGNLDEGR